MWVLENFGLSGVSKQLKSGGNGPILDIAWMCDEKPVRVRSGQVRSQLEAKLPSWHFCLIYTLRTAGPNMGSEIDNAAGRVIENHLVSAIG